MSKYVANGKVKLGLVLSGGGSKGAYEIGVYKALKKLGKKPNIITGTSVGALNGVLLVQNDYYSAVKLWRSISFSRVYDENSFPVCDNPALTSIYKLYVKAFITEGGMDVSKLRLLFDKYYNPRKFFASNIDYGLVTYNLSKNEPLFMTKKDLSADTVKDYVMASASCYPAFKPQKIGDDLYIDGGYYDNLPINLAVSLGAEEIIAVDLRAVGFKRPTKVDVPVTMISPRNKIVSFLVFDKEKSREALRYGYNDAMKVFGKLDGNLFTFKKNNLVSNYNKYGSLFEDKVYSILDGTPEGILSKIVSTSLFKSIIKDKVSYKHFNRLVEKAGECFNFPSDIIYNIRTYNKGLLTELSKTISISPEIVAEKVKTGDFKGLVELRQVVRLFYEAICNDKIRDVLLFLPVFADEFLVALYLYILKKNVRGFY
ncbi:MAG: patatin-like phospholipase family protein [Bacilli bacterium]|nr:patatin-like phospholipase family protein [Bacilli bacterium]